MKLFIAPHLCHMKRGRTNYFLGTDGLKYGDIGWTGPNFASAGCAFEKLSISGGLYITAGTSFVKGNKDTPLHLSHTPSYRRQIDYTRNLNVVLYDVQDRVGWLVDGTSALLHISRTQLSSKTFVNSKYFKISDFHHADPADGVDASYNALTDVRNLDLALYDEIIETWEEETTDDKGHTTTVKKSKKKKWSFQQLVEDNWHIIEQILDYQSKLSAAPGIGIRGTCRDKLEGFGFMDIVES